MKGHCSYTKNLCTDDCTGAVVMGADAFRSQSQWTVVRPDDLSDRIRIGDRPSVGALLDCVMSLMSRRSGKDLLKSPIFV